MSSKNDKLTRVVVASPDHEHNGRKCAPGEVIEVDPSLVGGLVQTCVIQEPDVPALTEPAPAAGGKPSTPRKES